MRDATVQPASGAAHLFRPRPSRPAQRTVVGGVLAACAGVLLSLLAGVFLPVPHAAVPSAASQRAATGSASELPVSAGSQAGTAVRLTQPRAVTLQPSDLPAGTRVASEGPAAFRSGNAGTPPPSWEVLLQLDPAQSPDYRYVESLAVVYPRDQVAAAAMSSMDAQELAAGASEKTVAAPLAARETIWLEQSPNQPGEMIVRVTWQSMNVVGQVSVFGRTGQTGLERAQQLALVEQSRIADPVAYREAS